MTSETYDRIYEVIEQIPEGNVATYGQIARLAGLGGHARLVGYALHACDRPVPWHRVINARGEVSDRADAYAEQLQHRLLAKEGVRFDERGRIALEQFRWEDEEADAE
ncbi:MAG: MGMT family protein [Gemmatimonadetes bacterium]|nr:MGMT family protein [Gemmatimonadota bacterium]